MGDRREGCPRRRSGGLVLRFSAGPPLDNSPPPEGLQMLARTRTARHSAIGAGGPGGHGAAASSAAIPGGGSGDGPSVTEPDEARRQLVANAVLAEAVTSTTERTRLGLPTDDETPFWMIAELNLRHVGALEGARAAYLALHAAALPARPAPEPVTNTFYRSLLSVRDARALVAADEVKACQGALHLPRVAGLPVGAPDRSLDAHGEGRRRTPRLLCGGAGHHLGRHRLGHRRAAPALHRARHPGRPGGRPAP